MRGVVGTALLTLPRAAGHCPALLWALQQAPGSVCQAAGLVFQVTLAGPHDAQDAWKSVFQWWLKALSVFP